MIIDCLSVCLRCIDECPVDCIYLATVNGDIKNVFIKTEDCICCGGCLSVCPGWALMKIENECTTRNNGGGSGSGDSGGWDGGGGGGGGSSAPVLSPVIKPLVGKHSLSPDQLRRLNDSVKELDGNCFFNALFKEFKRKGYTPFTDVKVDPTYLGNAGFRGDYVLRFGWDDAISTAGTVGEEFFHLYQLRGYMANGSITSRNPVTGYIEFEAKLLQDIINYNNGNWSDYLNALGYADLSDKVDYRNWLNEITRGGTCYPTQINFDTYDAFARLFASTHKLYKDLGLKFDKKLQPDALTDIIKKSDCK